MACSLSRYTKLLVATLLFAVAVLVSTTAFAKRTVSEIADRLRNADDFRVRVQAALALGASHSNAAVSPLCDGLNDRNATVRTAAAAGLGRLKKRKGLGCLNKRLKSEANASVEFQIKRAIKDIGGGGELSRAPNGSTKWYVAVAPTKNKGGRRASEIDAIVQAAVRKTLLANQSIAVAPSGETSSQAQSIFSKHKVRGYLLKPIVEAPAYADAKLTIRVRLTMFSYPNETLQGEFSPKLTQSGTPSEDIRSENELIKMAFERAVARFIRVAETTNN